MKKLHWTQTPAGKRKLKLAVKKRKERHKIAMKRSKVSDLVGDAVASPLNGHQDSVKELLESLYDATENISEAARQIADRLGLEM